MRLSVAPRAAHPAPPTGEANLAAARRIVGALVACGLREVCLAAGSRSTPLVVACAERDELHITTHVDERSAGFFALGTSRETGRPLAVICTSGSAVSNLHPAVTESFYGGAGLILITADRPARLQGCGAPQTIDQVGLLAPHVRSALHVEVSTDPVDADAIARLWEVADTDGPVHLNVAFDEPLLPEAASAGISSLPEFRDRPRSTPPSMDALETPGALFSGSGVVVVGPVLAARERVGQGLVDFVRATGAAVLADPLSRQRGPATLGTADAWLRSARVRKALQPDWILRVGRTPTSKWIQTWLDSAHGTQIALDPEGVARHPREAIGQVIPGAPDAVLGALARRVTGVASPPVATLDVLDRIVREAIEAHLARAPWWLEGNLVRTLDRVAPPAARLFAASSMPIREVDTFLPDSPRVVFANRGANGIDGQVSTVLGIAHASGGPTYGLLGDLALLHDVGGLQAARHLKRGAVLVVVNNDGGGIFEYLPIARQPALLEDYFVLPHGHDFEHAAAQFGLEYARPDSLPAFEAALSPPGNATSRLVEIRVDRKASVARHEALWNDINRRCEAALP